jgi:hypothetical protein
MQQDDGFLVYGIINFMAVQRGQPNKRGMMFAIKAEVSDPRAKTYAFAVQKTMCGGKHIAKGDTIFVFASENKDGPGLIATGVITSAKTIAKNVRLPAKRHA